VFHAKRKRFTVRDPGPFPAMVFGYGSTSDTMCLSARARGRATATSDRAGTSRMRSRASEFSIINLALEKTASPCEARTAAPTFHVACT
jgi:hypothetical protein